MRHQESREQEEFFRRASYRKYGAGLLRDYLYSVPNALPYGGKQAMLQMLQLRREGLTKGVPDIECAIAIKPYTGWHCEMKRADGVPSDVKPEQRQRMAMLTECGRMCDIGFGAEDAWRKLCGYLKIPT